MAPRRVSDSCTVSVDLVQTPMLLLTFPLGRRRNNFICLILGKEDVPLVGIDWFSGSEERTLQTDYLEAEEKALPSGSLEQGCGLEGSPILACRISDPFHRGDYFR